MNQKSSDPRTELAFDSALLGLRIDPKICGDDPEARVYEPVANSKSVFSRFEINIELPFVEQLAEQLCDRMERSVYGDKEKGSWEKLNKTTKSVWRDVAHEAIIQLMHWEQFDNLPFSSALQACKLGALIRRPDWEEGLALMAPAAFGPEPLLFVRMPEDGKRRSITKKQLAELHTNMMHDILQHDWQIAQPWQINASYIQEVVSKVYHTREGEVLTCL